MENKILELYLVSIDSAIAFLSFRLLICKKEGKVWSFLAWLVAMAPLIITQFIK